MHTLWAMSAAPVPVPGAPEAPGPSRAVGVVLTVLAGVWLVAVTIAAHALGVAADQLIAALEVHEPWWLWPAVAWLPAVLGAIPALLLATLSRLRWARVIGRGWVAAALAGGVLGTVRLVPGAFYEGYLALLALAALVLAVPGRGRAGPRLGAFGAGLVVLAPWLWFGSLGGPVESVLAAVAAFAVGWLVQRHVEPVLRTGDAFRSRWARAAVTGLAVGAALVGVGAGVGQRGAELLVLLALPALGPVAAALGRTSLTLLVGLGCLGPLAFADPVQLSVVLGLADVGLWAAVAAASAMVLALLLFPVYSLAPQPWPRRPVAVGAVLVVAAGAVTVHIGLGHPGFHGDRLFVVMRQQADLSGLPADVHQRRAETYRRLVDTATRSQASLRRALSGHGLSYTPYYLVDGLSVDGDQVVRAWLLRRPDVARVLLNPELRPLPRAAGVMHGDDPAPTSPQWNLTAIRADQVWSQLHDTGTGIVVGASDSGVDGSHPALAGGFRGGDDSWLDPFGGRTPTDHQGHGTHTLATAVGAGVGVAPGATWMGCVNLPRNLGSPAAYLTCLQYMLAPYPPGGDPLRDGRPARAADVLTNSWGCPPMEGCDRATFAPAIAALTGAGIFVVVAAGNSGPQCGSVQDPPATYPGAFTVGAVDDTNRVTDFSSRGPAPGGVDKPDVTAPGQHVLSALPGGGYGYLDGTSMAAPHVAGVVALMWSANPALVGDVAGTARILRATATRGTDTTACADAQGAGRVDALAAVRAAEGASR